MGGPNPDRVNPPAMPLVAMTLGEMHAKGWTLRSQCRRCGVVLRVHLDVMVRILGPGAIGWGRSPPCPVIADNRFPCEGRLTYMARTGRAGSWTSLARPPTPRELESWRHNRDNAAYNAYRGRDPKTAD